MKKINKIQNILPLLIVLIFLFGTRCKKFINVPAPKTSLNAANVFDDDATASAVLTGIYVSMSQSDIASESFLGLCVLPSLSADELDLADFGDQAKTAYYRNNLKGLRSGSQFWYFYTAIYSANSAIEGLNNSNTLTPSLKQQLLGESKFIRAFYYFYLANLFGDVPLALTSDYKINSQLGRASKNQVYQQIINDLKDAQAELSSNYIMGDAITAYPNGSEERVRPNKGAATALLARVYLYYAYLTNNKADFKNAEDQATAAIANNFYSLSRNLNNVFSKTSHEAIWQLQPVNAQVNTSEAQFYILPSTGAGLFYPVFLSKRLVRSFEKGDARKVSWIDSVNANGKTFYYPFKYKVNTGAVVSEYSTILRLGEQYLIRAEARAQQDNFSGAAADINSIRDRAGLPNTTAADQISLLSAVLQERKVELFTEYGQRWLDLKRTGTINNVMSTVTKEKGGIWNPNWSLYPIPQSELNYAPNLFGHQNPGY